MTLTRSFLVDPPRPGEVNALVLLDVDGVINAIPEDTDRSTLPTVPGSTGRQLPIRMIADEILDELEGVLQSPGARLGWLTTWGALVERLEPLLSGRLRGGFVVAERPKGRFVSIDWKANAATALMQQHPSSRLAWVDDDAVAVGMHYGQLAQNFPGAVLIAPDPEVGLTLEDAQRVAAHLSAE